CFLVDGIGHSRCRHGKNRVAGDSIAAQALSRAESKTQDSCFSCRITGLTRTAQRGVRGKIDDPAVAALAHVRGRKAAGAKGALEMAVQHTIPIFFFHVEDHPIADDAGEVYEDVEFSIGCRTSCSSVSLSTSS